MIAKNYLKENERPLLSLRIPAKAKQRLIEESKAAGLNLSAYCETQLLNFDQKCLELAKVKQDFFQLQMESKAALSTARVLKTENVQLRNEIEILKKRCEIFSNPKLFELYNQLKGTDPEIKLLNGEVKKLSINSREDLLVVLINSFTLKNTKCV